MRGESCSGRTRCHVPGLATKAALQEGEEAPGMSPLEPEDKDVPGAREKVRTAQFGGWERAARKACISPGGREDTDPLQGESRQTMRGNMERTRNSTVRNTQAHQLRTGRGWPLSRAREGTHVAHHQGAARLRRTWGRIRVRWGSFFNGA